MATIPLRQAFEKKVISFEKPEIVDGALSVVWMIQKDDKIEYDAKGKAKVVQNDPIKTPKMKNDLLSEKAQLEELLDNCNFLLEQFD